MTYYNNYWVVNGKTINEVTGFFRGNYFYINGTKRVKKINKDNVYFELYEYAFLYLQSKLKKECNDIMIAKVTPGIYETIGMYHRINKDEGKLVSIIRFKEEV